ncbi:Hypothetical predicted protein [Lecanosticta acicola]|uniref:Uncharacterized protein n=1 Tax=Lecanosticta acicola TaxID=111012 RepID=A0AAI8Z302_9PEZI|nr:Hypothetical predicted protein [Lecanosticta acicola]
MDHHAPHKNAVFEGYYSKFDLPSGAHITLVVCTVKGAKTRPHMLSFTYVPRDNAAQTYQREIWPDKIDMTKSGKGTGFVLEIPEIGYVNWHDDASAEYRLAHHDFIFTAKQSSGTPWSETATTPESLLVNLPLPLHWHVQSLASNCTFELSIPGYDLSDADSLGNAVVHAEKNWASSFPSAHMWLQAREEDRGFCCAGGQILGMEAFLLGYRSKNLSIDFRPPWATRIAGLSPFMTYSTEWDGRRFTLSVQSLRSKICVEATAPKGTFFSLSSPFPEGHRENYLGQSFEATIVIKIYESGFFTPWRLVLEDRFENASLEFGGAYYPPRGSKERFH